MIRAGDSIVNPVTGERLVFRQTARETGGEAVVIETYVQPNGFVAAAHVHPAQEERFQVLRGSVGFKVGGKKLVASDDVVRDAGVREIDRAQGAQPARRHGIGIARGLAITPRRRRQRNEPSNVALPTES